MKGFVDILAVTVIFTSISSQVKSDASKHIYQKGDPVPLYANWAGPYGNPSETYPYYSLPFCQPDPLKQKKQSIGEVLNGDHLASSPYKIDFRMEHELQVVCGKNLTRHEVSLFRTAIEQDYLWEMYYDDLPFWGFIGYVGPGYFIFTHTDFKILYSGDHVIGILAMNTHPAELADGKEVDLNFTYAIMWQETNITFDKRMDEYIDISRHLPHNIKIHHVAISNSLWTVLILFGCLVVLYVRVLRKDIYEYASDQESARDHEETGWKILHADVFRYPKYKSLFAAAIGSGTQLLILSMLILVLGLTGLFHPYDRGVYKTALIISYAITCGVAGFFAVSFYHQLEGTDWMRNVFLTGCIFGGPLFLSFCVLNAVATIYGLTVALPIGGIVVIFLLWMCLALPLLLLGAFFGKVTDWHFQAPCHTSNCPREIPALHWYRGALPQMALAGFLPFVFIFIELYDIFDAVWGYRVYNLYGILCIVVVLVIIATAFVSVGLTYFQLAAEDHQWWWRSFLCGGSTGLYIFGYCFYYYFKSQMRGFIQTSFFFGYMACICNGIFLMLGTVGFRASLLFIRYIYGSIKCD
ncbi:transmembrane 9 superfamily member 2 isoform X1 [Coffea arabica]|uniref:Transmembrane 9 superfamily member n=2 Tax=Coffea arabica TaxID=13443 RepID=A0A6P6UYV2_COFAR|nr:transmembrane 9 superfamily member 2-like isoform X1 [Coffea arabica]